MHSSQSSIPIIHQPLLPKVRQDVDDYLSAFLKAETERAALMDPYYERLWDTLGRYYRSGGKRLRPYVAMLAYEGCGGTHYEGMLPIVAALEMLHASMLIHDDIIDRDETRHGKPNVAGWYRTYYRDVQKETGHYAMSAALLAGDLALSSAYQLIARSALPVEKRMLANRLLGEAIFSVVAGELLDTEAVLLPESKVDVMRIASLKTASYSFVTPLTMGADMASAGEEVRLGLKRYGELLGIAFQLADDLLGLFGDEMVTGKSVTSDIEEGKRTYVMMTTLRHASEDDRRWLEGVLGKAGIDRPTAERVRRIAEECGARDETMQLVRRYADEARAVLGDLAVQTEARTELDRLITLATERSA